MQTRVALVTGGGRGIGRAVALDLGRSGWQVAIASFTSTSGAEEAQATIERAGGEAACFFADLREARAARQLVAEVEARFGRLDAVVNAAGGFHRVPLLDETAEGWREAFASNVDHLLYLSQAAAPGMKARGFGRIVAFSMAAADRLRAYREITAHAVAKTAVLMLARALAKELAPFGITVNTVSPGFLSADGAAPPELAAQIPAGRVGRPEDAAAVVRFFLSDEAGYITGAEVPVSGGWGL